MTTNETKKAPNEAEPPLSRTARRQQRTRANLVSAVRELTAEKGVGALTIRDIAEKADIAQGSFYNHFETKEDLLHEAVGQIVFESGEIIDSINAGTEDSLEVIARAFSTFDGMIQKDPILGWFLVRVSAHNPEWTQTLYHRFLRDVKEGIAKGQFKVPNVPMAVDSIGASLLAFYRARLTKRADDDAGVDFIHLMLRLLGADEEAAKSTARRVWDSVKSDNQEK